MPAPSSERLSRVHVNLYVKDYICLKRRFGRGWSKHIRDLVKEDCKAWRKKMRSLVYDLEGEEDE